MTSRSLKLQRDFLSPLTLFSPQVRESIFRNPGNFCLLNPEFGKILLVESVLRENFVRGIQNSITFCSWNPGSLALESGIQLEIPLTIRFNNPSSTDKDWNPESMAWNPESKTALDSVAWGDSLYNVGELLGSLLPNKLPQVYKEKQAVCCRGNQAIRWLARE